MIFSPLSLFFLLLLAGYWLHGLWRVIASGSGSAQCGFVAAYLVVAIVLRLGLPSLSLIPVWAPFLYPYAWCGVMALFWSAAEMRVSRRGIRFEGEAPRLSAFLLAQLALHVGVIATAHLTAGRSVVIYLTMPPLMACLGLLLYPVFLFISRRRLDGSVGWSSLILFSVAAPLAGIAIAERLVPVLLRHY